MQAVLLDVQEVDSRLERLARREQTLPETVRLTELGEQRAAVASRLAVQGVEVDDLGTELRKAERDVAQVRTRRERDQQRLDTGAVTSARDLEVLQREIVNLDRRIGELEDAELEVMEQQEAAQAGHRESEATLAALDAEAESTTRSRDEELGAIHDEAAGLRAERERATSALPAELLTLYERVRAQHAGVGAGLLRGHRCEACRLELNAADLREIAAAPDDEVLRCPECNRLLVRAAPAP